MVSCFKLRKKNSIYRTDHSGLSIQCSRLAFFLNWIDTRSFPFAFVVTAVGTGTTLYVWPLDLKSSWSSWTFGWYTELTLCILLLMFTLCCLTGLELHVAQISSHLALLPILGPGMESFMCHIVKVLQQYMCDTTSHCHVWDYCRLTESKPKKTWPNAWIIAVTWKRFGKAGMLHIIAISWGIFRHVYIADLAASHDSVLLRLTWWRDPIIEHHKWLYCSFWTSYMRSYYCPTDCRATFAFEGTCIFLLEAHDGGSSMCGLFSPLWQFGMIWNGESVLQICCHHHRSADSAPFFYSYFSRAWGRIPHIQQARVSTAYVWCSLNYTFQCSWNKFHANMALGMWACWICGALRLVSDCIPL